MYVKGEDTPKTNSNRGIRAKEKSKGWYPKKGKKHAEDAERKKVMERMGELKSVGKKQSKEG